jgi:hypothetical protein
MTYLYIYLAVALPTGMFACFRGGWNYDYDDAIGGCLMALVWPIVAVALLAWLPFGGAFWLGGKISGQSPRPPAGDLPLPRRSDVAPPPARPSR